ncbi:hypothetical protein [Flavobacterium terrigena]|uniref:Uncharacterized protein n=1 Tax=Flavobacterium terrigena TaxID=402734 RepID=A0A1H6UMB9_9FLAO|nr:hypothetical protein [Flavobacterium terrigena]SEI93438.1 hypothetical protein SAMN05660918_1966 [Flavobacterium terrigena]
MNAAEFKNGIRLIKENLKGLTLQLANSNGYISFKTLNEFGGAILEEEKKGYDFRIKKVWTIDGSVGVKSIKHLAELFKTSNVTAIQFESFWNPKTKEEFMRSFGALD